MRQLSDLELRQFGGGEKLDEADPIWGQIGSVYSSPIYGRIVRVNRSGSFICAPNLREMLAGWSPASKARLTTWITDRNRAGDEFPIIAPDVLVAVRERRSLRYSAKVDRFLAYLSSRGFRIGEQVIPGNSVETPDSLAIKHTIARWIEAADDGELWGFMRALCSAGIVSETSGRWSLTADGLERLESLDAIGAESDQAFVAMWFGKDMEAVFDEGFAPGLEQAGYRAFRVDRKEHSGKIDDEIIAEIRRSRFLVADFTCELVPTKNGQIHVPRGGVYYEAGFAQGLNMPVIWSVREDQIDMVHFDTRQFNHIVWKDAADLKEKLYRRVAAVIGHYGAVNTVPR